MKRNKSGLFLITGLFLVVGGRVTWGVGGQQEMVTGQGGGVKVESKTVQVMEKNQVQTKNQGEEQQLEVMTQEQEMTGEGVGSIGRGEMAKEKMSIVAGKVEELLTSEVGQGGIGEKVREIAQEQKQEQLKLEEGLNKLESRNKWLKKVLGPDYRTLKVLNQQMERNQVRIERLEQLKLEVTNQSEADKLEEMIQALIEQNTALEEQVGLEEQAGGLFGWLFKFLIR